MSKKKTKKKVVTTTTTTTTVVEGNNLTQIVCVLDASSSMYGVIREARDSFNKFIKDQKELDGDAIVSIARFSSGHDNNNGYELIRDSIPIKQFENLTENDWSANGMTALYDAIGKAINDTVRSNKKLDEQPDKTLFVIFTDGEENSSKEFTDSSVKAMIEEQQKNGWEFIYLGANQNAFSASSSLGISKGNTRGYTSSIKGNQVVFDTLSNATAMYRTSNTTTGNVMFAATGDVENLGEETIDSSDNSDDDI